MCEQERGHCTFLVSAVGRLNYVFLIFSVLLSVARLVNFVYSIAASNKLLTTV